MKNEFNSVIILESGHPIGHIVSKYQQNLMNIMYILSHACDSISFAIEEVDSIEEKEDEEDEAE